jgi:hypothetical protein
MKERFFIEEKNELPLKEGDLLFRDGERGEGRMEERRVEEGEMEGKEKKEGEGMSLEEIKGLNIKLYEQYGINLADVLAIRTLLESKVGEINEERNSQEMGELTSGIRKLKETLERVNEAHQNEIKILLLLLLRLKEGNKRRRK